MKSISLAVALVLLTVFVHAQPVAEPADKIMSAAFEKAAKENKHVMVMFHASWCVWCHRMDSSMNDAVCQKYFSDNYVIVHLAVEESAKNKALENPGAAAIKAKYHAEKAGLPFWVVLDSKGNLIGDSFIRAAGVSQNEPGDNIGCPAEDNEVEAFTHLLKISSSLNDKQLAVIAERFKKNKATH